MWLSSLKHVVSFLSFLLQVIKFLDSKGASICSWVRHVDPPLVSHIVKAGTSFNFTCSMFEDTIGSGTPGRCIESICKCHLVSTSRSCFDLDCYSSCHLLFVGRRSGVHLDIDALADKILACQIYIHEVVVVVC